MRSAWLRWPNAESSRAGRGLGEETGRKGEQDTVPELNRRAAHRHVQDMHDSNRRAQTGQGLASIPDKTLVMTDALSPTRFRGSDEAFDISSAIGALQSLPTGVHIAMNARLLDPAKVRKNVAASRFEAV